MPSRRGTEQALIWLKSKMAEGDTLDAINAEICYNVILDLKKKKQVIGALYHQSYTANKRMSERMDEMISDRYLTDHGFARVDVELPKEFTEEEGECLQESW